MNVDADDLRRHYDALSDEALLDVKPEDLTDVARQCYEAEFFHRGLKRAAPPELEDSEPEEPQASSPTSPLKSGTVPAAEFAEAEYAQQARDVLEQAGIPCSLESRDRRRYGAKWIALMVPRSFLESARQRLQTEIDEPSAEEDYAKHFVEFSDDELLDVDIETLPQTGRKWFRAELEQRGLEDAALTAMPDAPSEGVETADGFISVATLLEEEADAANRLLERESIPCRIERGGPEGAFESFAILVPASFFDQASEVLDQHQAEIFRRGATEEEHAVDDPS